MQLEHALHETVALFGGRRHRLPRSESRRYSSALAPSASTFGDGGSVETTYDEFDRIRDD
jgi:hypothetical protein